MSFEWQNIAALCLVVAACAYAVRRAWRAGTSKKAGPCGSCVACPGRPGDEALIYLDPPREKPGP